MWNSGLGSSDGWLVVLAGVVWGRFFLDPFEAVVSSFD
jgi:hypothetical protein